VSRDGAAKSVLAQPRRAKLGRQVSKARGGSVDLAPKVGNARPCLRLGKVVLDGPEVERQRGQHLAHLVVELTSDRRTLRLLRLDRPPESLGGGALARMGGLDGRRAQQPLALLGEGAGVPERDRRVAREGGQEPACGRVEGAGADRRQHSDQLAVRNDARRARSRAVPASATW
jgi:hypothetical protein